MTRTTSVDGRWVFTLYQNPGGYPFVHALDTVHARCALRRVAVEGERSELAQPDRSVSARPHARIELEERQAVLNVNTATWKLRVTA